MAFPRLAKAPVTTALLAIIFAMFGVEWFAGALRSDVMLFRLGAIAPEMITQHQYWRAVSAMFLHANLLHLAANTWTLYQLGTLYETMFGSARFVAIYFATGIIASFASAFLTNGLAVGASGAILGILGAFIFSIKRSPQWKHEPWTKSLLSQLMFWAAVNLALGYKIQNIDNAAHIAGLVSGLILGFIPHRVPPPPPADAIIDVPRREF
jgi:rhomboid protease GluP